MGIRRPREGAQHTDVTATSSETGHRLVETHRAVKHVERKQKPDVCDFWVFLFFGKFYDDDCRFPNITFERKINLSTAKYQFTGFWPCSDFVNSFFQKGPPRIPETQKGVHLESRNPTAIGFYFIIFGLILFLKKAATKFLKENIR